MSDRRSWGRDIGREIGEDGERREIAIFGETNIVIHEMLSWLISEVGVRYLLSMDVYATSTV